MRGVSVVVRASGSLRHCGRQNMRQVSSYVLVVSFALLVGVGHASEHADHAIAQNAKLAKYVAAREAEFDQIPPARKKALLQLTKYVQQRLATGGPIKLLFVCTHNSRNSHLSQIWTATAAMHYGLDRVVAYSGGMVATAFNPRAAAALKRAGFEVAKKTDGPNPLYEVRASAGAKPWQCYSKVYSDSANPTSSFAAVMTCDEAAEHCPNVPGADTRVAIPFAELSEADNTPQEVSKYDEICRQIARELLFAFSRVKQTAAGH